MGEGGDRTHEKVPVPHGTDRDTPLFHRPDEQWELIRPLVERDRHLGRPTTGNLQEVVNALLYLTRTGCPWRLLPTDFPNWNTVRYYFDAWTLESTFIRIIDALRVQARQNWVSGRF